MLIDTREPPPPPGGDEPRRWRLESDGELLAWFAATVALFAGAVSVPPAMGLFLAFVGVCTAWRTLEAFVGVGWGGQRDWRQ